MSGVYRYQEKIKDELVRAYSDVYTMIDEFTKLQPVQPVQPVQQFDEKDEQATLFVAETKQHNYTTLILLVLIVQITILLVIILKK